MAYDLRITGGTIVDGTGAPGRRGDVGIRDGVVVALGDAPESAAVELDATGRVVCPGFVDIHTHYDAQILWDRMCTVSPWHGVTTAVLGNCGFGVAPTRPEHRELVVGTLEKVEGMSAAALLAGLGREWPFETFPEYLDVLEQRGAAINTAVLVGHTPLRLYVLGAEATEREATPEEVARLAGLVAEALAAGAVGFATSKSDTHVGYGGRPVPSRAAAHDELLAVADALAAAPAGIIQATMGRGLAFAEFAELAERTGHPVSWTALLGNIGPGIAQALLDESIRIQDAGVPVYPQVSCRPLQFEFTLAEPFPFENLPELAPISAARSHDEKVAVYRDPAFRAAWAAVMATGRAGTFSASWDRVVVSWHPADPGIEERNVAELAAQRGVDPTDLVLDLALATDLASRFRFAAYNYGEDEVGPLLADPHTMLGLSDAGAHASQLCDACFSTYLLGRWVRELGVLPLEEAVRKLTSEPARIFGLRDRGLLAVGRPADVVVFDPATVGAGPLRRVADQPAGQERLVVDAVGIDAVVVNGTLLRRDGADVLDPDGPLPGRLLRHGTAS